MAKTEGTTEKKKMGSDYPNFGFPGSTTLSACRGCRQTTTACLMGD
jgi:hypothetical protein